MLPTIDDAANAIRTGTLSPVELVLRCLDAVDRYEPRVRAWVLIDRAGARAEAERLEKAAHRGEWRGPLHGIPLGIKDIIDVAGWPTAAGSRLWANNMAFRDAEVVTRLRQAGAILLGKTVTTPYASFDPPPTRNPWNLERTPGGSSSGSAATVACGMCLGALGSQTGGSLTRPASYCGVATCKPSFGAVSVDGVLPLAPSMDHVGPIARCVHDLAILLKVIAGQGALALLRRSRTSKQISIGANAERSFGFTRRLVPGTRRRFGANQSGMGNRAASVVRGFGRASGVPAVVQRGAQTSPDCHGGRSSGFSQGASSAASG